MGNECNEGGVFMNIIILGAAGFIGTNLFLRLNSDKRNHITLVDQKMEYFSNLKKMELQNVKYVEMQFSDKRKYDELLKGQEIVYHLVSSSTPTTSNQHIQDEIRNNIVFTSNLLESCIKANVKMVIFMSSGGTVYGKEVNCPVKEEDKTNPITSYGFQKLAIEKMLYLYKYVYNLDYKIIRLANPYGPYQRPNGKLGAVTTFVYKTLRGDVIDIYGDGEVIRDYIYIDDVIDAIINITYSTCKENIFNVGSGFGTSLNQLLKIITETLNTEVSVNYLSARSVDVPINYLDVNLYNSIFKTKINTVKLSDGIIKTARFLQAEYL